MKKIPIHSLLFLTTLFPALTLFPQDFTPDAEVIKVIRKAGKNGEKLYDVLRHYSSQKDTLKWEAACFLIRNMDIHASETYFWTDTSDKRVEFNEFDYPSYEEAVATFNKRSSQEKIKPVPIKIQDIEQIGSDYLIRHIDNSFLLKKQKWAFRLSFEDFCEYLLPYRNVVEPIDEWQDVYRKRFAHLIDPKKTVSENIKSINTDLESWFQNTFVLGKSKEPQPFLSPLQLLFRKQGPCEDMVNLTLFALRSQGFAGSIDFVPAWGTSTGKHYWNTVIDNGRFLPFEGATKGGTENFRIPREPSKVIRITYGKQPGVLAGYLDKKDIPAGYMQWYNYKDVTREYWRVRDIQCSLYPTSEKIAYISVHNNGKWIPVYWGKIENGKAQFKDMCCGVAYVPYTYKNGKTICSGDPVLLHADGQQETLKINKNKIIKIRIPEKEHYLKFRKNKTYTLFYWDKKWIACGSKKITDQKSLTFSVPANTLYQLIPEYSRHKERPFSVNKNNDLIYW